MFLHSLLLVALLAGAPDGGATSCSATPRYVAFGEGERLFTQVKVGWTQARVRALLGEPQSCEGSTWLYSAGLPDGPLIQYRFRIRRGVVTHIEESGAACIYRERVE